VSSPIAPQVAPLSAQYGYRPLRYRGLVKNLVEMHGGRAEARSAGPGHGSKFAVRLPVLRDECL
jgi:hypothetical protein